MVNVPPMSLLMDGGENGPNISQPSTLWVGGTGLISVAQDGKNESEGLSLSAKNALLNMIDHLETRGFTRQQAHAPCSVAVELRIGQAVDVRNLLVSALPSLRGAEGFGS